MPITNELEALKALLSCVGADGARVSDVWLEEKDPSAKLKKLKLTELKEDMLILATDEGRKVANPICMSPLFVLDGSYDQNRACDAVIVKKSKTGGVELFYIDLKSDIATGYEGQFKSTACFMRYVCNLCEILCEFSVKVVRERYIVFHTDSSGKAPKGRKMKTRFKPSSANTPASPDKFIVKDKDQIRCTEIF
jgi:hypothetical protein